MTQTLSFSFESPQAGWLPLHISTLDAEVSFEVSYTPNDFVEELIAAASSVLADEGTVNVTINEEPEQTTLTLRRRADVVTLALTREGINDPLFVFSGRIASVVLPDLARAATSGNGPSTVRMAPTIPQTINGPTFTGC